MAYLIGTAGHVDHGKTTLIAALTGIDADRLPEEKARGMTIDLGFAYLDLEGIGRVSIVDVPGHEKFIKNMLAGASGVDVALLCVSADEGVMAQTKEHFEILKLLEAKKLIVAITKTDLVDSESIELVKLDIASLLEHTPFNNVPIIEVSAKKGIGLENLKNEIKTAILSLGNRNISEDEWFMPIDRVFTSQGHGTVVTGTLAMGTVKKGSNCEILPGKILAKIKNIQVHGTNKDTAEAGQRVAINLSGIKNELLHRGQSIGSVGVLTESNCVNIRLVRLKNIKHGERIRIHIGTGEFLGKVFLFDNCEQIAQLRLEETIACTLGQRVVLRKYSPPYILAGGEIITPSATQRRKNDKTIQNLISINNSNSVLSDEERILQETEKHPEGIKTEELCELIGKSTQALGNAFEKLKKDRQIMGFAGIWLSPKNYHNLSQRTKQQLMNLHAKHDKELGIKKEVLLNALQLSWNSKMFDRFISQLNEEGNVILHGSLVMHPEHKIKINEKQKLLLEKISQVMNDKGVSAPTSEEISTILNIPKHAVEEIWRIGLAMQVFIKIGDNFIYTTDTLQQIIKTVKQLAPKFTVAQFRDATGSSRKYAVPILEYLDEIKITRRSGDERLVL